MTSEGITCSTKDVYPEPNISWFRDGRSEDKFTVNRTGDKEGLFSVSSVLTQSVAENTTYSCSISLRDESQHYTASLRKGEYTVKHLNKLLVKHLNKHFVKHLI